MKTKTATVAAVALAGALASVAVPATASAALDIERLRPGVCAAAKGGSTQANIELALSKRDAQTGATLAGAAFRVEGAYTPSGESEWRPRGGAFAFDWVLNRNAQATELEAAALAAIEVAANAQAQVDAAVENWDAAHPGAIAAAEQRSQDANAAWIAAGTAARQAAEAATEAQATWSTLVVEAETLRGQGELTPEEAARLADLDDTLIPEALAARDEARAASDAARDLEISTGATYREAAEELRALSAERSAAGAELAAALNLTELMHAEQEAVRAVHAYNEADEDLRTTVITTDAEGIASVPVTVCGAEGSLLLTLTEVQAPGGYITLPAPVDILVTHDGHGGWAVAEDSEAADAAIAPTGGGQDGYDYVQDALLDVVVLNEAVEEPTEPVEPVEPTEPVEPAEPVKPADPPKPATLAATGGELDTAPVVLGGALLAGGLAALGAALWRRRKQA